MDHFVHPSASCEASRVGAGSRISAFARVDPSAALGRECQVGESASIGDGVELGDRVRVGSGARLCGPVAVEADVVVGPNVALVGEAFPGAAASGAGVRVERGAVIGASATVLADVTIGQSAVVRPGSLVTRSVPPYAIVMGNPAQIVGYVESAQKTAGPVFRAAGSEAPGVFPTGVRGVTVHRFPVFQDMRGALSVGDFERQIPFLPRRYFMVFDVPGREVRGEHAHRSCHLFLLCPQGSYRVVADDGTNREEFVLDGPHLGVHLPPMVWGVQYRYSPDAVLLAFASDHYDPDDYIRDYAEFRRETSGD